MKTKQKTSITGGKNRKKEKVYVVVFGKPNINKKNIEFFAV